MGKKNDHSLKYEKPANTVSGVSKKSEYHSVLQHKKGFEDRFKSSAITNDKANQTITNDFLLQDHDQQGSVRAPLETSYHAPSKRTLQSLSKKSISSSNSRQTQKYIEQLPNSPIAEGSELEMENQLPDKEMQSEHRKQMNKFETAFFKDPSKNALQVTNGITGDEDNIDPQHNLSSEISFREKQDSDEIPDQGNYANGLQISVHLTMVNHF